MFFSQIRRLDLALTGGIFVLALFSLVSLYSFNRVLFQKQLIWYILFFLTVFFGSYVNWRWLITQAWFRHSLYWVSVFLVFIANFQTHSIRGTKSWISVGSFQFQPAEMVKLALILLLAGFFSRRYVEAWLGRNILISLFYAGLPSLFVILHPDLGSALVIMGIWLGFLFLGGFHLKRVLIIFFVFLLVAVIGWFFVLRPYQKDRFTGFLFPDRDPLGASYNVIQSKIAIGSAGFLGKGFGFGTQTHLQFLPEAETDFLFSAFIEEWGVLGGILLLLTFLFVVFSITGLGLFSRTNDYRFISLGVALVLMIHFFVNAGANVGLLPVTGIAFPFLSYGGSHLLTLGILVSIIQRVKIES